MSDEDLIAPYFTGSHAALPRDQRPTPPGWRPRWLFTFAAILASAVVVGSGWVVVAETSSDGSRTFALRGAQTLSIGASVRIGSTTDCRGTAGYEDVRAGTQVTVYDEAGHVMSVGSLGEGLLDPTAGSGIAGLAPCVFVVSVPNVPKGPKRYQVQVSHHSMTTISAADAEAGLFAATLGT